MTPPLPLDLQLVTRLDGIDHMSPDRRGVVVLLARSHTGKTLALVVNSN